MAALLVVPVSRWRRWSLPGLTAPFGSGTSWVAPFLSKKPQNSAPKRPAGLGQLAAQQPHPPG